MRKSLREGGKVENIKQEERELVRQRKIKKDGMVGRKTKRKNCILVPSYSHLFYTYLLNIPPLQ